MKRVYSTDNIAKAWNIRNVLEQQGIEAVVKNEQLYSVAGELPITECMPEVWVKPLYCQRAEQIIAEIENAPEPQGADWHCTHCGESNAINFALCWNCEGSDDRPPADDSL
jgi:hypothetical protein